MEIKNINFDLLDVSEMKIELYKIFKEKKPIDILVNSAGIIHGGLFQMTPIDDIRRVFDVNFFGLLELTQFISKYMIRFKRKYNQYFICSRIRFKFWKLCLWYI